MQVNDKFECLYFVFLDKSIASNAPNLIWIRCTLSLICQSLSFGLVHTVSEVFGVSVKVDFSSYMTPNNN